MNPIGFNNYYDLELDKLQDKIDRFTDVVEENGQAFISIFHSGGFQDEKLSDMEGFLQRVGLDINLIDGNIDSVLMNTLAILSYQLDKFVQENFNTYGYTVKLKICKLFANEDVCMFLYKE